MPYTPSAVPKRMLSWRDDEVVYDLAVQIADETGESKQTAFGRIFRTGIALYDAMDAVREYLADQREDEVERLGESPDAWSRKQAEVQSGLYDLYRPTDQEVISWIQQAVRERIAGNSPERISRQRKRAIVMAQENYSQGDQLIPDGERVGMGNAPVDEETAVITFTAPMYLEACDIRVGAWSFQLLDAGTKVWSTRHSDTTMAMYVTTPFTADFVDRLRAKFDADDGVITVSVSLLNLITGEFESVRDLDTYEVGKPPTSAVVRWPGYAVRIDEDGVTYYHEARDDGWMIGNIESSITLAYNGYTFRMVDRREDILVSRPTDLIG